MKIMVSDIIIDILFNSSQLVSDILYLTATFYSIGVISPMFDYDSIFNWSHMSNI
jgi:hypothetical protein